ncbi:serine protease FAM111A-like [Alosa sapidissima]|uniref:serine protease FAM111A-like n=1 Tax=Alosa sapidissima TaxID=34773 RepID=UPI001C09EB54|nr:serine protease FAM111A-like [Alosa sapidissima]
MAESKPSKKTFRYSLNGKKLCTISSDNSSEVLNALLIDSDFEKIHTTKAGMDLIIKRKKPNIPAIGVRFPCCLLENDEELEIRFIKRDQKTKQKKTKTSQHLPLGKPEKLVIFHVSTTGKKGLKRNVIMENKRLKNEVDCVCVVGVKGETVKDALRRDGRFAEDLFTKDFALEDNENIITKMKNSVDELKDHKLYSFALNSPDAIPDSLEMLDDLDDHQSQSCSKEDMADSHPLSRISDGQSSGKALLASGKKEMTTTSKSKRTKKVEILGKIPNTGEILKILRDQFDSLVRHLKAREGIKSAEQVRELLREEFSKETQGFSEIKTLKMLMERSASICQVYYNNQALGTGFLLFGRFILTNAHVITDQNKENLLNNLSVSFSFEDFSPENKKHFALKRRPIAFEYKSTQQHNVDFALLELKKSPEALPPPLLQHYSAPPVRGGVCVIGHPDSGVKKMDTCLIIERENQLKAAEKHAAENSDFFQVIKDTYFNRKQELDGSQIEYNSCFFYGASGSPVFDEHCNVIGIHTGGYVYKRTKPIGSILEYGLPLLPVLVSILRQTKDKHEHVWESFLAEKNTKLVIQYAEDMTFRPDLTGNRAWESDLHVDSYEEEDKEEDEDKIKEEEDEHMDVGEEEEDDEEEEADSDEEEQEEEEADSDEQEEEQDEDDEDDDDTEGKAKKRKLSILHFFRAQTGNNPHT